MGGLLLALHFVGLDAVVEFSQRRLKKSTSKDITGEVLLHLLNKQQPMRSELCTFPSRNFFLFIILPTHPLDSEGLIQYANCVPFSLLVVGCLLLSSVEIFFTKTLLVWHVMKHLNSLLNQRDYFKTKARGGIYFSVMQTELSIISTTVGACFTRCGHIDQYSSILHSIRFFFRNKVIGVIV